MPVTTTRVTGDAPGVGTATWTDVGRVVIWENDESRGGRHPGEYFIELYVDNSAGRDLGGGTARVQISHKRQPVTATDADWYDYIDASGATLDLALGRSYAIQSRASWIAINLVGATTPDLVVKVS